MLEGNTCHDRGIRTLVPFIWSRSRNPLIPFGFKVRSLGVFARSTSWGKYWTCHRDFYHFIDYICVNIVIVCIETFIWILNYISKNINFQLYFLNYIFKNYVSKLYVKLYKKEFVTNMCELRLKDWKLIEIFNNINYYCYVLYVIIYLYIITWDKWFSIQDRAYI